MTAKVDPLYGCLFVASYFMIRPRTISYISSLVYMKDLPPAGMFVAFPSTP